MNNRFFSSPPQSVGEVFSTVLKIAKEHWKPLGLISIFQILAMSVAILVLLLFSFLVAASELMNLFNTLKDIQSGALDMNNGGFHRSLVDHSVGFNGASRFLDEYYEDMDDDEMPDIFSTQTILVLLSLFLLWIIVLSLVSSLGAGAFYHALGIIYTGGFPSVKESISRGVSRMWSVYFFSLLYSLAIVVLLLLMVGLPAQGGNVGTILLGYIFFIITMVLFDSLMTAAKPSIVVERQSAVKAFQRSFELCKGFLCFIFCTELSFTLTMFLVGILTNLIFGHLPGPLAFIGHFFVNIVSQTLTPILAFVIYMAVRVRKENTAIEDLAMEIGNNEVAIANAVEMQDDIETKPIDSSEML